jgi:20S proteasome alpha/beta subunit
MGVVEKTEIELPQTDLLMTLILGAKCVDGVALIGDSKFTFTDVHGSHYVYGDKIVRELNGVLTGFSGDLGAFQVFTRTLRNYISSKRQEDIKKVMAQPLHAPIIGPTIDQVMLKISQIQKEFYDKYSKNRYGVLIGISGNYFPDRNSVLYQFYSDGRCVPILGSKTIGSGSQYASYFLKRYWHFNQTTMLQFAQLCDFIIRYISHKRITLDFGVGLRDERSHPQIIFIPNNTDLIGTSEGGRPKLDSLPTESQLEEFRYNSETMINNLHEMPPPWSDNPDKSEQRRD